MNEIEFKQQFISCFLASWCAVNYTDYCMRGMHEQLSNPPVEDAIHLANDAWAEYRKNIDSERKRILKDVVESAAIVKRI